MKVELASVLELLHSVHRARIALTSRLLLPSQAGLCLRNRVPSFDGAQAGQSTARKQHAMAPKATADTAMNAASAARS